MLLELPGYPVQIFGNPPVAEGHPNLQTVVHAHSVLPVKKGLHEPAEIQIDHFLHPGFQRRCTRENVAFPAGLAVGLHHEFFTSIRIPSQKHRGSLGGVLSPGEARSGAHLRIPIPGIAPENLVGALPGQSHLGVLPDLAAEGKQRKVHIRHPRQIPGNGSVLQRLTQIFRGQYGQMLLRAESLAHDFNIATVC